jgi:hypothetical protein
MSFYKKILVFWYVVLGHLENNSERNGPWRLASTSAMSDTVYQSARYHI